MRKYVYVVIILLISFSPAYSQCPGCITDSLCSHFPAKPTICPNFLPDGYALQAYQADLSFYLPANFEDSATGFDVTLNELHVTGVTGMPSGLSFQTCSPTNIFYPSSNPPITEYGCARFCGTPLIPGNYIITVYVTAYVTVLGMSQTSDDAFDIPVTILPNPSSNASFTINNPMGCVPLTTGFSANNASGGNPLYSFSWDFGNGNQSSLETPPQQTYTSPGTYLVSLETVIDTFAYTLSSVHIVNSDCDDPFDDPDYYIKIRRNSTEIFNNSGSYSSNNTSPTFNFTPIVLQDSTYYINVWENDDFMGGGQTGDDECGTVSFNGHSAGPYTLVNGSLTVTFTVNHDVLTFNDTDTIVVYPLPVIQNFSAYPADTACSDDTIQLTISGGDSWQWFLDGAPIVGAQDSVYTALISGNYHVLVTNTFGCQASSTIIAISVLPIPPYPSFYPSGNQLITSLTGYSYQWYLDNTAIPGATTSTIEVTQTGYYSLELTAANGCTRISAPFYAVLQAVDEIAYRSLKAYPNPVQNQLFIDPAPEGSAWIITDVTGRIAMSGRLNDPFIMLPELEKGVYLLKIITVDAEFTTRFIKE